MENVRRVELPAAPIEGGGQGAASIAKEATSSGAEGPSADHSDEETSVERALVDRGSNLQKENREWPF